MTNLSDLANNMADAVETVSMSVVSVRAERPISGTVIGDGLVLTVAHVLHGDEVTVVTHDGRKLSATVAGRDGTSDLALLKVEGLNLPALGASGGVRVGELLLAVGRPPHGIRATLGLMQRQPTQDMPERGRRSRGWLPSGAAPFRGVSGGVLVDARGALVGILNAGVSRSELLAVPAERAMKVAELLGSTGRVPRGYLGIATQRVMFPQPGGTEAGTENETTQRGPRAGQGNWGREQGQGREGWGGGGRGGWGPGERGWGPGDRGPNRWGPNGWGLGGRGPNGWGPGGRGPGGWGPWGQGGKIGLTVVSVEQGSPAAQAGLLVGDVMLSLDDQPVRRPPELLWHIRERAGQSLSARILRGGQEQDVTLVIGER
ncbi:S1C family serine protease [Deinococcus arenicola]|uniref:Trypsin-like peptidase domain-containing protein n=1 Tax=Deinococcus arenicola TaxID=2994950 RepID=A0ABU4DN47_9DEIO|nr:trypsin-like peptidase domain-containing protein [Deinococcus sp. ZS9-10]MDV6373861.1 trypsin-like peptidase domain-containing protein [Deinococcus sp. ZS9-10]